MHAQARFDGAGIAGCPPEAFGVKPGASKTVFAAGRYRMVEECDDGNLDNNDGCSHQCTIEPNFACTPQRVGPALCV